MHAGRREPVHVDELTVVDADSDGIPTAEICHWCVLGRPDAFEAPVLEHHYQIREKRMPEGMGPQGPRADSIRSGR